MENKFSRKVQKQIGEIRNVLKGFGKSGASIEEIEDKLSIEIPRRTLQRRLADMQPAFVIAKGVARATRYHLIEEKTEPVKVANEPSIPLSKDGEEILILVTRPRDQRIPVAYHREFLENYQPNETSFLSNSDKAKLLAIGKTRGEHQPAGTYVKQILQRLLIDLSYNSSRLEGNTYSLLDTERLIKYQETPDDKTAKETQMILNHKAAIEFMVQSAEDLEISRYTILSLHALLSDNLLPDSAASGRLRSIAVEIGGSVYTPLAIPQLIEEMFEMIIAKANQIDDLFEQSFFLMVHLPYLQPFEDVNKRVSRLAVNIPLNSNNLSPVSFAQVPGDLYFCGMLGVYELNRVELLKDVFIWAYERSAARYAAVQQTLGEPDHFRLKYRDEIRGAVTEVVTNAMDRREASDAIKKRSMEITENDRTKFIEYVDTELMSLHEGNFARYFIRPAEFAGWKEIWDRK
jgi:Fic family protein